MAYNLSHHPGLHGHEHALEVKYSYSPQTGGGVKMFCSDADLERTLDATGFNDPDAIIRYAVDLERRLAKEYTQTIPGGKVSGCDLPRRLLRSDATEY